MIARTTWKSRRERAAGDGRPLLLRGLQMRVPVLIFALVTALSPGAFAESNEFNLQFDLGVYEA